MTSASDPEDPQRTEERTSSAHSLELETIELINPGVHSRGLAATRRRGGCLKF